MAVNAAGEHADNGSIGYDSKVVEIALVVAVVAVAKNADAAVVAAAVDVVDAVVVTIGGFVEAVVVDGDWQQCHLSIQDVVVVVVAVVLFDLENSKRIQQN